MSSNYIGLFGQSISKATTLQSATGFIDISSAPAPTTGQVLTATSPSVAIWSNPSGGAASAFSTTGADVNVSLSAPPAIGNVLVATSATSATWQAGGVGTGDTIAPATNTDNFIPQWNGTDSKTLKNGLIAPVGAIVGTSDTQSLTNKTITDTSNNVASKSLHSLTTVIDVAGATAPTSGQVLTAINNTSAEWVTPTVGTGDVTGAPVVTADSNIAIYSGTGGKTLKDSVWNVTATALRKDGNNILDRTDDEITVGNATVTSIVPGIDKIVALGIEGKGFNSISLSGSTTGGIRFAAAPNGTSETYVLPPNSGSSGQVMTLTMPGKTLSWATPPPTGITETSTNALLNKSFFDDSNYFVDNVDITKKFQFQCSGITAATTRILTVPDISDTLTTGSSTQLILNKTITDSSNTITANRIRTTLSEVIISPTAPSSGQVLTASSETAASWVSPVVGGLKTVSTVAVSTALTTQQIINVNLGTITTMTIPDAIPNGGREYTIIKINATPGDVDVTSAVASQLFFNGVATTTITMSGAQGERLSLMSNGIHWFVM